MSKIVTTIVVVVAVLIAAAAGLPFWFGMRAEAAYEAMLQKMATGGEFTGAIDAVDAEHRALLTPLAHRPLPRAPAR